MSLIIVYVFSGLIVNAVSEPILYDQRQTGDTNVRIDIKDATFILMEGELGDYDYSYDYSDLTVKPETMQTSTTKPISSSLPESPAHAPLLPSSTSSSSSTTSSLPLSSSSPASPLSLETTTSTSTSTSTESSTGTISNSTFVIEKENNTLTITPNKQDPNSSAPDKIQILEPQQPLNSHNFQIPVVVIHEKQTEAEKPTAGKPPEKTYVSSNSIRRKNNSSAAVISTEDLPLRNCSPGFFLDSKNRCKRIRKPLEQRKRPHLPFGLRFAQRPESITA